MTEKERAIQALKELRDDCYEDDGYGNMTDECAEKLWAIDTAIKALRKQKTARRINISGTDCQCSHCRSWNDTMDKYCWLCGAELGG